MVLMDKTLTGKKVKQSQMFLQDGTRVPVTMIKTLEDLDESFRPGDLTQVTGTSRGRGFAGVVKRHHFKGGPRTHGQSDRERAPGSIGQTTTPGRVYKGKRMAGRMGGKKVTIKNLPLLEIDVAKKLLIIKGLVPGSKFNKLIIRKIGEVKKFVPLYKEEVENGH